MQLLNEYFNSLAQHCKHLRTDNSKCTLNVVGGPKKYETSCFIPLKHEMNTEKSVL